MQPKEGLAKLSRHPQAKDGHQRSPVSPKSGPDFVSLSCSITGWEQTPEKHGLCAKVAVGTLSHLCSLCLEVIKVHCRSQQRGGKFYRPINFEIAEFHNFQELWVHVSIADLPKKIRKKEICWIQHFPNLFDDAVSFHRMVPRNRV